MDLTVLKTEITTDPLGLGYTGKTFTEIADLLNAVPAAPAVGRRRDRGVAESHRVFEAIDRTEYAALTPVDRDMLNSLLAMGTVNLRGANTRAVLAGMFGPGTATRAAVAVLQFEPISRAEFLSFGFVGAGNVEGALALP